MIKKVKSLIKSFQFAVNGLVVIFKTQRNAKIIFALGLLAIILGVYLRIPNSEFLIIILTVGLVFVAEIFNTLVEETQNLFSKKVHPKVKLIKDMAAGAVLVASIISLIVGALIFLKYIFS
jgi:diacylglycerol kinase